MESKIGITQAHLNQSAHLLNGILADEFLLYVKTRNAHWNVEGPDFYGKHLFFENQYQQLDTIVDDLAERIRMLGHYAIATLKGFLEITHLSERLQEANDSEGYIKELLADHETVIKHLRSGVIQTMKLKDAGTSDYLTGLAETHEKMAWMLRAHFK